MVAVDTSHLVLDLREAEIGAIKPAIAAVHRIDYANLNSWRNRNASKSPPLLGSSGGRFLPKQLGQTESRTAACQTSWQGIEVLIEVFALGLASWRCLLGQARYLAEIG